MKLHCYLVLALAACSPKSAAVVPDDAPAALQVSRGDFHDPLLISGVLDASDSASILSPQGAWGVTIRWMADDGSHVNKGDKVLEIDNSGILRELDSQEQQVLRARNDITEQQTSSTLSMVEKKHLLRQAQSTLQRAKLDASVPADAYPRRTYENMQLALKRAQVAHTDAQEAVAMERTVSASALSQKRIVLAKALRAIEATNAKMKGYVVHAPRDGIVVASQFWRQDRPYQIGDKTWPGQVIMKQPNLSAMRVNALLSDVDDGQVVVGAKVSCTLDAYPALRFAGRVVDMSPVARAPRHRSLRRSFDVIVELEETDEATMRPGMSVQVEIQNVTPEMLIVPREAIAFRQGKTMLLLASGDQPEVDLDRCSARQCTLRSSIAEGTKLRSREMATTR